MLGPENMGSKIFLVKKMFGFLIFCLIFGSGKILGQQKYLAPKKFWVQKLVSKKKVLPNKNVVSKKILGKKFQVQDHLALKIFGSIKFLTEYPRWSPVWQYWMKEDAVGKKFGFDPKNFFLKIFGCKNVFKILKKKLILGQR